MLLVSIKREKRKAAERLEAEKKKAVERGDN
jgi:hypothetical protein